MRKTRIICTLGPATATMEKMKALIEAGLNVARFNFSHGDHESHKEMADKFKQAAKEMDSPVALLLDTKGPEIRIKTFKEGRAELEKGKTFTLTSNEVEGTESIVSVTYPGLAEDVRVGGIILLDDGLVELKVESTTATDVVCTVMNSGVIKDKKGVNLPDVSVKLPALTEKDISDIKFAIREDFHFIAASFIRSADDVRQIRKVLRENGGGHIQIMSKIENHEGVKNADEIIEESDSIMVARGDLGVEINPEEVPIVQKNLIKKANRAGKPVVTATQMLESMITKPRPTRAEANDVANAIFDGTDAIMLSGETANGEYPTEAVTMMARISQKAEESIEYYKNIRSQNEGRISPTDAISYATSHITQDIEASGILTLTTSGFTARMVSKFRPFAPIITITPNEIVYRQMSLVWGAIPILVVEAESKRELLEMSVAAAVEKTSLKEGDVIVIVSGMPLGVSGTTNNVRVHVIGGRL